MTFLNPLLLFGGLSIAAPIILHLFMSRKVKKMVWAAMRFLEESVAKNQKRLNLEDLILLALRCALLLLLALALARPIFGGSGVAAAAGGKGAAGTDVAVIALDTSYSMGQSDGGLSRFDLARKAGEQVLDNLPAGSSVAVLLFSDVVQAAIPEPTVDFNLARKIIRGAHLSARPTSIGSVVAAAQETLARRGAPGGSIYLITDGQANGWEPWEDTRTALTTNPASTHVILVGGAEDHNLAVSDLRLASAIANVGTAAQFEVEVTNYGVEDAKAVAVKLSLDGEPPADEGAIETIPPGAAKRLSLFARFRAPGYHSVTARIDADHLTTDDSRTVAVRAVDDIRVLLVDGDPGTEPRAAETFYLRNALTPVPLAERERYFLKTKVIAPAELAASKLTDYEAVVLANVADVSPPALEAITAYLRRGGGLIIFPGDKTSVSFYNETLGQKLALLPATLGIPHGDAEKRDKPFTLQAKDYQNPIVSIWNDPGAGTLSTAQFYRAFQLTPATGRTAEAGEPGVVLHYSDNSPAVMERSWARGRVILFSSTADTAWNDLPLRPAFVPLMARTLGAILDRQDARLNLPVGGTFEFVGDPDWAEKDATITPPDAGKESATLRHIGLVDGLPLLQFSDTTQAGAYQATVKTDPPSVVKFATQFNAVESNLTEINQARLDSLAPAVSVQRWTEGARLDVKGGKGGGGGREIWSWLATLALVVACVEVGLAAVWSTSK